MNDQPMLGPAELEALAWVDRDQMAEVDRIMTEDLGIQLIQMMEHAGRHLAALTRDRFLDGNPSGRPVVVLVGTGGNGGGGLVAARRLWGWGADVRIVTAAPPQRYTPTPRAQLLIAERLGIPISDQPVLQSPESVIIDALVGYSLAGPLRDRVAALATWAMQQSAPALSLDTPTGLDATTGESASQAVRPAATLTLAMPKIGLRPGAPVGELYLADIGVPPSVYTPVVGRPVPTPFTAADLVRLR